MKTTIAAIILVFLLWALFFAGCIDRKSRIGFISMAGYSLADSDGYENIVFGVPRTSADTVLHRIGYSAGYNYKLKLSVWVSYYTCLDWIDNKAIVGRNFRSDPDLPEDFRAYDSDYRKSGYDRGHLAKQADMRGRSELCEREACFLSNIAPQLPKCNRVLWKRLEDEIVDYIEMNGDCWVVTGPIFFDNEYETIGDNQIPIPDAFYKVMLDTLDNGLLAYAFIMPNHGSDLPIDSFAVSIDSIETVAAIDLFAELPDEIETLLEKQVSFPREGVIQ